MKGIVDRFEGEFVVIEIDGVITNISKELVAEDVEEGYVVNINVEDGNIVSVVLNQEDTRSRKQYIEDLTKDMWE